MRFVLLCSRVLILTFFLVYDPVILFDCGAGNVTVDEGRQ
jgi:hypothetical protein